MKVYKFGGASIKSASAVKNMCNIISSTSGKGLLVVVSAMGKTTNALEIILEQKRTGKQYHTNLQQVKDHHYNIIGELFPLEHPIEEKVGRLFDDLEKNLNHEFGYATHYDQVIPFGELISSTIISEYLNLKSATSLWLDARNYIITDDTFREGKVDWDITYENIRGEIPKILEEQIIITQGFIGGYQNLTTTLGREGSDFSAAIFASGLNAVSVTIWKDVPGILNADPNHFPDAQLFTELSYQEAAEMTYYGATVIHPKTIKPLANRSIPLIVKSFDNPEVEGTIIHARNMAELPPAIIIKENQSLVSLTVKDLTFVNEDNLKIIFHQLSLLNIKINMMQNSAVSFMICIDYDFNKIQQLKEYLKEQFEVSVQHDLKLLTIKNYSQESLRKNVDLSKVALEQRTTFTYQVLLTL